MRQLLTVGMLIALSSFGLAQETPLTRSTTYVDMSEPIRFPWQEELGPPVYTRDTNGSVIRWQQVSIHHGPGWGSTGGVNIWYIDRIVVEWVKTQATQNEEYRTINVWQLRDLEAKKLLEKERSRLTEPVYRIRKAAPLKTEDQSREIDNVDLSRLVGNAVR